MFSTRVPGDLTSNRLTAALVRLRHEGRRLFDLTLSNPTRAGLRYPQDLLVGLASAPALEYQPRPLGLDAARAAVAADYARRGVAISPDRIVLTASTSEAYSLLFKILCDPGDDILIPHPSYPLFEHLTQLDGVAATPYPLDYYGRWAIDLPALESAMSPRTRAVLVVSPNNPTGSYISVAELTALERICAPRGVAIIVDEVFADYPLSAAGVMAVGQPVACRAALTCSLGGLSKTIGLPQAKLGWIGLGGPEALVAAALTRLEFVCDTYLSVSTPVQVAAADLLERGAVIRTAIQARIAANLDRLSQMTASTPSCRVLTVEGGWYGVLQVPTFGSEEDLALELLVEHGVVVHPGYFFDFARGSFLVVSLLPPAEEFAAGVDIILRHFDCRAGQHVRG